MAKALDARLFAVASFVREGAVFADIGTDHAYLPLYLCETGTIKRAYACDVAKGPIEMAKAHIRDAGYAFEIEAVLTDGLDGVLARGVTDVAICGMGGELIASILERADIRDTTLNLILQPQTKPAYLRTWLCTHGFSIEEERVVKDAGRYYTVLLCRYTGENTVLSEREAALGAYNMAHTENETVRTYIAEYDRRQARIAKEKALAGTKMRKKKETEIG